MVNLKPGRHHRGQDNAEDTSSLGEHANHRQAGAPGPGRASDPIQLRIAQPTLLKEGQAAQSEEGAEVGTLVPASASGEP